MGYSKADRTARMRLHADSGEKCECGGSMRMVADSLVCDSCFKIGGFEEQVEHTIDMVKEKDKQKKDKLRKKKLKDLRNRFADGEPTTS